MNERFLSVRVTDDLIRAIDERAEQDGISRSDVVKYAIARHLDSLHIKNEVEGIDHRVQYLETEVSKVRQAFMVLLDAIIEE